MRTLQALAAVFAWTTLAAPAGADPISPGWTQPGGPGTGLSLTYSYSNLLDGGFNASLTPTELRHLTGQALGIWAAYAPISFHEIADAGPPPGESEYPAVSSDIRIGYQSVLADGHVAHVHEPMERGGYVSGGLAGDIHLSNDTGAMGKSYWGYGARDPLALDFFSVMLHEVGHSLGVSHLNEAGAVMGPRLIFFAGGADLHPADIQALRALYGSGAGSVYTLPPGALSTPEPATWLLIGSGVAVLVRHSRRRARV